MVIKELSRVSLWDKSSINSLMVGIRIAPGSAEYEDLDKQFTSTTSNDRDFSALGLPMFMPSQPNTGVEMQCSHCKATFTTRQEQIEHYRLDWHKCNLRRAIAGKAPLSEEQFDNDISDVSSISGSEDSSEDDDEANNTIHNDDTDQVLSRQPRIFFQNADGLVLSMYKAVLFSKKCQMNGEEDAVIRAQGVLGNQLWAVMLLGGGHFAAAIFKGNDVVVHKTFHNYTVRAKQGGGQSSKDNQSGTSHPKSAGSSLRRYNEMSQKQHIQELMESWKPQLAQCKVIFYHAKHQNRTTLFGGKNAILDSQDSRLRTIPFPTKRAKFSEVKRIYGLLSEVYVHGTEEEFRSMVNESINKDAKPVVKKKKEQSPSKKPERKPKSERRDSPLHFQASSSEESEAESDTEFSLVSSMVTLRTGELGGVEDECSQNIDESRKEAAKKRSRRAANKKSNQRKGIAPRNPAFDLLYTACKTGDLEMLSSQMELILTQKSQGDSESKEEKTEMPENLINVTFGVQQKTLLHIASENDQADLIWWLLENGCDPSAPDKKGVFPYNTAKGKTTQVIYKQFLAAYPEIYDYKKANIPIPLTPEEEEEEEALRVERRKAKRQAQRERQKLKQKEEKAKKKEEEERERYLQLSDREKCALAAERRLLQRSQEASAPSQVLQRCFTCAKDIAGMVPFEYNDYKFCSTTCVREHRTKKS